MKKLAKTIVFVINQTNKEKYAICKGAIESLNVPDDFCVEIYPWQNEAQKDIGECYNKGYRKYCGKYKVYLSDQVCILNENFINDIIEIFSQDEQIAALGVSGMLKKPLAKAGNDRENIVGCYQYLDVTGDIITQKYSFADEQGWYVQGLDGMILVTQYDLYWDTYREPEVNTLEIRHLFQAFAYLNHGYKIYVPQQKKPWCLYLDVVSGCMDQLYDNWYVKAYILGQLGNRAKDFYPYSINFHVQIADTVVFYGVEYMELHRNVAIGEKCWLAVQGDNSNFAKLVLQEHTRLNSGCRLEAKNSIVLEQYVFCDNDVYITDASVESAFTERAARDTIAGGIYIGEHCTIGAHSVIQGNLKLGRGCLVLPNSTVLNDVPDYCVVGGCPARILKVFDGESGVWEDVADTANAEMLLEKRRGIKPILTIGIPTYNRSFYLQKTLELVLYSAGNNPFIEVLVCDNASEDDTPELVKKYQTKYTNIRYHRNKENIGGRNFEKVWTIAKGEYVLALGDDDYYEKDFVHVLLDCIFTNRMASLISILPIYEHFSIERCNGLDDFVSKVSRTSTSISAVVFKQKYFLELPDKLKWGSGHLNQVYLQMEIIKRHPIFAVMQGNIARFDCGEAGFNVSEPVADCFCDIFIREYFEILQSYLGQGLSGHVFRQDKADVLSKFILPMLALIQEGDWLWSVDKNLMEIYDYWYKDEPYYLEGKERIMKYVV